MEQISYSRSLPVCGSYDVIVVGAGPAGCAAAVAAAKGGAKTLIVDAASALGGMSTNGLVPWWCGFSNGGAVCTNGFAKKLLELQQAGLSEELRHQKKLSIDPEKLKRIYDTLLEEAGAESLLDTRLADAAASADGTVEYIVVSNKGGLSAYKAKVFVDATGDGDLAAWAGADFALGDEYGEMQNATMCFVLSNVNMEAYRKIQSHRPAVFPNGGKYPLIADDHCVTTVVGENCVAFNAGSLYGADGTDPRSVSETLTKGRRLVEQIVAAVRENLPEAYGNAVLVKTQSSLGIREGRRILGDYVLTREDYFARRTFPDDIARNCFHFDSHETARERELIAQGLFEEKSNLEVAYAPGESHGIPYRCLIPKKLKNVLTAGRCISTERRVQASIRVMSNCLSTGEAAGSAAALAVRQGGEVRKVDIGELRGVLRANGAELPEV